LARSCLSVVFIITNFTDPAYALKNERKQGLFQTYVVIQLELRFRPSYTNLCYVLNNKMNT